MDVIEIDTDNIDLGEIDIESFNNDMHSDNDNDNKQSVNFGSGIELLMNDNSKSNNQKSSKIEIDDINNLEDELNSLSKITPKFTNNIDFDVKKDNIESGNHEGGNREVNFSNKPKNESK